MRTLVETIGKYLHTVTEPFLTNTGSAELRVARSNEGDLIRFRLILEQEDVARVIGRNGMTASAIRSLAKSVGERHGVRVVVHILSQEEAALDAAS